VTAKALANEVAKNLVLAGIGSLTIIDHQTVTEEDLGAQFFAAEAQSEQDVIGKNVGPPDPTNISHPNKRSAQKQQDPRSAR
jgi:ubiquitin-like 1-activating enzyme E1 A